MIPKTLADVATSTAAGASFDLCLRNFLDGFYDRPTVMALVEKPIRLADTANPLGKIEDAYLAATAEWLAWKFNLRTPHWALDESRSLRRPWFASELDSLRALLLLESPTAFRSRNLFVSENALTRA